jgi:hypothetical protein
MSFTDKIKDNHKARKDLALLCNRPSLELKSYGGKPHAPFCLKVRDRKEVLIWLKNLKFPYGYTAGFKRAVNLNRISKRLNSVTKMLFGGKSSRVLPTDTLFQGCSTAGRRRAEMMRHMDPSLMGSSTHS